MNNEATKKKLNDLFHSIIFSAGVRFQKNDTDYHYVTHQVPSKTNLIGLFGIQTPKVSP